MADTTMPEARAAYYQKEQIRILRVRLSRFRTSLEECTIPKRRAWIAERIEELRLALYERTGMWY
jgi:hypothetical protein